MVLPMIRELALFSLILCGNSFSRRCALILNVAFIEIKDDRFIIYRLFRDKIKFNINQHDGISPSILSIPGSNTLEIFFKNGFHFLFFGGGKSLSQIRRQIDSIIGETTSRSNP